MRSRAAPVAPGLIAILTLTTFTNHLNVVAWNPFLPFIADAHGISVELLGQVPALMLLLSALLGLLIGPLADRYGYRLTLLACLLAVATGSLATGLSTKLPLLVLAGVLGAVGRAAIMPVAQALASVKFLDETARRRAVSRIQNGGPLAATLGIPFLTVIAGAFGWRGAFVVLSGLTFVIALILSSMLRREEKIGGTQFSLADIASAYRPILRDRSSLILVVAACLENTGVNVMWTYYGAFYVQQHGFGVEQVGWVSLAAGLGVLLGQTAAGTRFGRRPQILFIVGCAGSGSLIGLSVMLAIPASDSITLMIIGWLLHGLVMVTTVVLLVGQSPVGRATTLSFYGSAMSLGMAMGAVLGGLALALAGFFALGVCTLILPIGSVVLLSFRPLRLLR